ncbi:unnamed protein product [Plutella xylostella]|uniref:(diamondback moth) hypothetical protein n=1 Tax=Plutella xylostella TaxID=51655 RepID=A0A8S4GEW0_PLUXY|nr:unnamed protein product [Plutella xylostella]
MAVVLPTPPIYDTSTPNDNVLKLFYKKMEHLADVTVIHDPHNFYARPKVYERFLNRMATRGDRVPTENLKVGLKAIYRSPKKRTFIRGEIKKLDLEAEEEVCDIFAYDYGFVEQDISIYNVYEFDYNNNLPPLALHCHLNNCKPLDGGDTWDPEAIQAFRHFAGEETTYTIKLFVPFGASDDKKEFTRKEVKAEDLLYVRALGGKSNEEFYVSVIDDYDQYMIERDSLSILTRNAKHVPLSEVVKGKPVSIFNKFHYRYERAIINKVIDNKGKAEIEYIDLGGYETSSMYLMKDVPVGYFERPGAALLCSAEYIGEYDEPLPFFMEPGYEFFVTVKEVGNGFEKPYILYPLSADNELY